MVCCKGPLICEHGNRLRQTPSKLWSVKRLSAMKCHLCLRMSSWSFSAWRRSFCPPNVFPCQNLVIFLFSMHLEREKGENLSHGDWEREYNQEMLASGMTTTYPCFFFREGLATGRSIDRTDTHHACVCTIALNDFPSVVFHSQRACSHADSRVAR
jgi:hypothetical protein